jgi:hypothetical protein
MLFSALVGLLARGRIGVWLCVGVWLCAPALLPSPARAWTEAHVREADVALSLRDDGRIDVELDLALEVRGGWLEQLELPGLDDGGLTLAKEEPALALLEGGEQVPAQVSRRASTLLLKFARRDGLRRGHHHLRVRYSLARPGVVSDAEQRLTWTLPGFEAGLRRAAIRVRGPSGMGALETPDVAQAVEPGDAAGRRVLTFTRVHVPRATPWTIAVALPQPVADRSDVPAQVAGGDGWEGGLATGVLLILASLALVWLMRLELTRALQREGLGVRGLGLTRPLSPVALCALSLAGALSFTRAPAVSIASWSALFVLGVPQAERTLGRLALGGFRPLTRAEHARLRRARVREWLGVPWSDLLSPLGSAGALGLVAFSLRPGSAEPFGREPWGVLALSGLFGLLVSARVLRPRSFAEQVGQLLRAARRARTVGCALSLVAYESEGRLSQPRLRLVPGARFPGLLRLEVLVDTRRSAPPLLLSALVEADSPAARWLAALFPRALRESGDGGRRVALLQPIDDVGAACERVLDQLSRESQRSLFARAGAANAA